MTGSVAGMQAVAVAAPHNRVARAREARALARES